MLRALFFILLLVNALLLAWNLNVLAPLGWPSTQAVDPAQSQQVRPEALQVLPAPAVPASAPALPASPPAVPTAVPASQP